MNIPLNERLNRTIQNIENRARQPAAAPAGLTIVRPTIPRTPAYYRQKAEEAKQRNEPYIQSVYIRAAKLAAEGKQREVNRLLYVSNQTLEQKRKPKKAVRKPNTRYHLRSTREFIRSCLMSEI